MLFEYSIIKKVTHAWKVNCRFFRGSGELILIGSREKGVLAVQNP